VKILVFSPLELPYTNGARYTGLERLAVQFAETSQKLGNEVTLMAHKDTSTTVNLLPCEGYPNNNRTTHAEQRAFMQYQSEFYKYDAIWDITNLHLPARFIRTLPIVNIFHANPEYAYQSGYIKAPYNLVSWSKWGIRQIAKYYRNGTPCLNGGQRAVYQETIMIDPDVYKPKGNRTDRFLTIGRMSEEKGNIHAITLCKQMGLNLDVAGGRGSEKIGGQELSDYEQHVMELCDGEQIRFLGEVSDEEKIELMQTCRGLIYATNHVEITSHKVQETMLCGAPVIIPNTGGMSEIVTHGIDGYLCNSLEEYGFSLKNVDKLTPSITRDRLVEKYCPKNVAQGYINLFERVIKGERW
jgi:glycosyltransferase involved in cell wall biosynthesis